MTSSELATDLAAAILDTPGVLRIEPTLPRTIRNLATAATGALGAGGSRGLTIIERAGPDGPVVQVGADIATAAGVPARDVARQVHRAILDRLAQAGVLAGAITINVLSIESLAVDGLAVDSPAAAPAEAPDSTPV